MLRPLYMFKLLGAFHHYQRRYGLLGLIAIQSAQSDCKDINNGGASFCTDMPVKVLLILGKVISMCCWAFIACFKTLSSRVRVLFEKAQSDAELPRPSPAKPSPGL